MLLSVQILQDSEKFTLKSLLDLSLKSVSPNLKQLCDFSHILQIYMLMFREVKWSAQYIERTLFTERELCTLK